MPFDFIDISLIVDTGRGSSVSCVAFF